MKNAIASSFLAFFAAWSVSARGGEIHQTVSSLPSELRTPLGLRSNTLEKKQTSIGCYDIFTGLFIDCGYDMSFRGLSPDPHAPAHPLGDLQVIAPALGARTTFVAGQTSNDIVFVSQQIPTASGKIDTVLNVRVPPGWHTVFPESLDATRTSWRFVTTVDVAVTGLTSLSGAPCGSAGVSVVRCRSADTAHTDDVAFFGTGDALVYLNAIADSFFLQADQPLSVNDMSLLKGGVFDIKNNYAPPHRTHRVGMSADINKTAGNCKQNKTLRAVVNDIMAPIPGSPFAINRTLNSLGRFLCEETGTKPTNNIHIDFDVQAPPSPSPFQ